MRRCPVCDIAMQASKLQENLAYFDKCGCLSCHTLINEPRPQPQENKHESR